MFLNLAKFKYVDKLLTLPAKDDHLPPPCIRRTLFPPSNHCGMNEGSEGDKSQIEKEKRKKPRKVRGVYDRMTA